MAHLDLSAQPDHKWLRLAHAKVQLIELALGAPELSLLVAQVADRGLRGELFKSASASACFTCSSTCVYCRELASW